MPDEPPADFSLTDALAPFTQEEFARLRRYVELAEELKRSRYFQQKESQKLEINFSGERASFDFRYPEDEELVTVMVARLRKLHTRGRPGTASFKRTVLLLRQHTEGRAGTSTDWFRKVLEWHEAYVEQISTSALVGLARESVDDEGNVVEEVARPAETFWDWVYAVYLHADEDRLARIESWRPFGGLQKFIFLQMATDLSRAYYGFFGIVREVLEEPGLMQGS
jgi:uncharacterized protein YkuJ